MTPFPLNEIQHGFGRLLLYCVHVHYTPKQKCARLAEENGRPRPRLRACWSVHAHVRNDCTSKRSLKHGLGKRRDARGFDLRVQLLVVAPELFVMTTVARLCSAIDG